MSASAQGHPVAAAATAAAIVLLLMVVAVLNCSAAIAQKKYVFVPGRRQAVEVDVGATGATGATRSGVYSRRQHTAGSRQAPTRPSSTGGAVRQGRTAAAPSKQRRSYNFTDSVQCNGRQRQFHVFVPASYDRSHALPVVLVFHGLNMSGSSMSAVTGLNGVASRNGFVAVYPESANGRWDDGMRRQSGGIDDVAYVRSVLSQLEKRLSIDRRRIYAVGLSNGGYFVQLLANSLPGKIRGLAVIGATVMEGALAGDGSHSRHGSSSTTGSTGADSQLPIPVIFFCGSEDPLVNWGDSRNRSLGGYAKALGIDSIDPADYALARYGGWLTVGDAIDYWKARNRCSGDGYKSYEPDRDPTDGMRVRKQIWGSRGAQVALYVIEGGVHSWPGTIVLPGSHLKSCQDIEAGEEIWKFFQYQ